MNGNKTNSDDSGTVDVNKGTEYERATVDFYNSTGGYGFFSRKEVSVDEDVFFYAEDITNAEDVAEGDVLDIKIEDYEKGPRADDLHLIKEDSEELLVYKELREIKETIEGLSCVVEVEAATDTDVVDTDELVDVIDREDASRSLVIYTPYKQELVSAFTNRFGGEEAALVKDMWYSLDDEEIEVCLITVYETRSERGYEPVDSVRNDDTDKTVMTDGGHEPGELEGDTARGAAASVQIMDTLRRHQQPMKTSDISGQIDVDIHEQTLRSVLKAMQTEDRIYRCNRKGEDSETGQYWFINPDFSHLQQVVKWVSNSQYLNMPWKDAVATDRSDADEMSEPEVLAHILMKADWADHSPHPETTHVRNVDYALKELDRVAYAKAFEDNPVATVAEWDESTQSGYILPDDDGENIWIVTLDEDSEYPTVDVDADTLEEGMKVRVDGIFDDLEEDERPVVIEMEVLDTGSDGDA